MIEHTLWEGTTRGSLSKGLSETEGLRDWQVAFNVDEWSSGDGLFSDNDSSTLGDALVNTSDAIIRALDLDQEDWLHKSWRCSKLATVEHTATGWNDLTTTSVDSVSVECDIRDVHADTSHVILSQDTFSRGPLEGRLQRVLDFV